MLMRGTMCRRKCLYQPSTPKGVDGAADRPRIVLTTHLSPNASPMTAPIIIPSFRSIRVSSSTPPRLYGCMVYTVLAAPIGHGITQVSWWETGAHSHSESALNLQTMRTRSILVGFIAAMLVSEMAAVECLEKEKCPGGQERCDANTSELDGESVCEVLCKPLLTQTSAAGHSKPYRKK